MLRKPLERCAVCASPFPTEWDPRTSELLCRDCAEERCRLRFDSLGFGARMELMGLERLEPEAR